MLRNVSGQFLFFDLVSVLSGFPVTGFSGLISGRKATDGISGMIVLSGNIIELGGGMYRANLFDFDTSGLQVGYFFTASGCVPRSFHVDTTDLSSGRSFPASGINTAVPPSSLSGIIANSGGFVTVPPATLSGVVVNSGLFATVPKATISGVIANSGLFTTTLPENLSGLIVNSGGFVTVPPATLSGVVANSGLNVVADVARWLTKVPRPLIASGYVDAFPGINAGTVRSGTANTIQLLTTAGEGTSGILDGCVVSIVEGLAKGQSRVIRNWGSSGIALVDTPWNVIPTDSTNFYIVTPTTSTASGTQFPSLPKAALSGVVANSGLFVTATATVASGLFVTVPPESISGVFATASLNSGEFVNVYSGQLSGQMVNAASGRTYLASGSVFPTTYASGTMTAYVPDRIIQRDFTGSSGLIASGLSGRCLVNAGRKLTNKFDFATSGYLSIFQEDDALLAYQQAVTTQSGAEPITQLDTR